MSVLQISPKHAAARMAASIVPAQQASLALLNAAPGPAAVHVFGHAQGVGETGADPSAPPVVIVPLESPAGSVDVDGVIVLLPVEALITGADPDDGTPAVWACIVDGEGDWWADATVSDTGGDGQIKLVSTLLLNGAYLRIESAVLPPALPVE